MSLFLILSIYYRIIIIRLLFIICSFYVALLNLYNLAHSLLIKGTRSALRYKVNNSLITGLSFIDICIPIGRGQRQLIIGDRSTGKTSIFLSILIISLLFNKLGSIDGFGTKRLFCIYIGINQNLSKIAYIINSLLFSIFFICISTHSSSTALLSFIIIFIGITIIERLRDRGFDCIICFDDCSQHSKSYRQISLILSKIPSRDAFPADIFNIHSSLLERSCALNRGFNNFNGGTISALPVIETINSDITDYIATNIISITDGQCYLSKQLFLESIRPSLDSALSVSRIGSAAQNK